MILMIFSIILFTIYAFVQNLPHLGVYIVMSIVAFLFLGSKADIPDDTWSPQKKGAWTKRYTTLKLKDNELIYVYGDNPAHKETFDIDKLEDVEYKKNKLLLHFKNSKTHKINAKYWNPNDVKSFVDSLNERAS